MGKKARLKKMKREVENDGVGSVSMPAMPPRPSKMLKTLVVAVLFLVIFIMGVFLRVRNLEVSMRSPDEKVYTQQAKTIVENGAQGIRLLVRQDASNPAMWIYPLPTRIGYLWPLAACMKLINSTDVKVGSYISSLSSIVSLALLTLLGLRFFNKWIALSGLLFLSVSPMDLAIARRTWQDAMFGCVGALLIWLACEISAASRRIVWYILFIVAGSWCVLIKETGFVLYGLCILCVLWILLARERAFLKAVLFSIFAAIGVVLSIWLLAYAAGGTSAVLEVLRHHKEAMPANQYAVDYQTGPWYNLLLGVWLMSPVNAALFIIGTAGVLFDDRFTTNRKSVLLILFVTITFMAVAIAAPYFQNLRYISVLYVPFYLVGGLGLWYVILFAGRLFKGFSLSAAIALIIIIAGAAASSDYRNFEKIFLKMGIVDLSIRLLKESSC